MTNAAGETNTEILASRAIVSCFMCQSYGGIHEEKV